MPAASACTPYCAGGPTAGANVSACAGGTAPVVGKPASRTGARGTISRAIREHADRLPEIIEAREALESKLAALAAELEDLR